ncbi:hypothetical protein ATV_gp04 [Bicaudavirus pozzuoliense]|uniref:Uncharacterized protein ORF59a n=2 Tax=Acidianus two-tailed virus TaxID=315953 RepID=Y059A_ATV|nr:hypothetical protein ATV_gp04 [Acidianus two-tailed virus]Q3V4T4.1 RecName: Full=Uncharacterized protein ORF59a [Acidianus two-tailed virus]AON96484.1 hypothetical protein [Acidianus two-tailed phage variant 1]CAI59880.1 hypothetical protein [Acidianus two-tailed virus]
MNQDQEEEKPTCYDLLKVKHDLNKYNENIIRQLKMSHAPIDACEIFLFLLEKWCTTGGR